MGWDFLLHLLGNEVNQTIRGKISQFHIYLSRIITLHSHDLMTPPKICGLKIRRYTRDRMRYASLEALPVPF